MPQRIQRKRTKGWRMPAGAIYVGRPTKWGNPAVVGRHINIWMAGARHNLLIPNRRYAADVFEALLTQPDVHLDWWGMPTGWEDQLRGHDLVCWCPLDSPCHADVLLELANDPPSNGESL